MGPACLDQRSPGGEAQASCGSAGEDCPGCLVRLYKSKLQDLHLARSGRAHEACLGGAPVSGNGPGAWPGEGRASDEPVRRSCWDQRSLKNSGSHIDASHSRQPLVKGERLVRYEVNAVMLRHGATFGGASSRSPPPLASAGAPTGWRMDSAWAAWQRVQETWRKHIVHFAICASSPCAPC